MHALKRTAVIVFAVILVFTASVFPSASQDEGKYITRNIDGVNTYRDDGMLVIYNTPGSSTGTNEWGYEVCVDADGKVISIGGNNNAVPEGGFVLSGHNSADGTGTASATFLADSIAVGDYVLFNANADMIVITDTLQFPSYDVKVIYDGINITRLTDQMIIYENRAQTNSNEWGYEVCVDSDGTVASIGGNNNAIPAGGYVVSGHGTSAEYLRSNIVIGMEAVRNAVERSVTFTYTAKALVRSNGIKLDNLTEAYESTVNRCAVIDYTAVKANLDAARDSLNAADAAYAESNDHLAYSAFSKKLAEDLSVIGSMLCESVPSEYRGVWIRPVQTSRKAVSEYVERLHANGINMLCIETLYNGYMIMPMPETSYFEQNPNWAGFDMLKVFIEECHKLGMELHVWMPVYYVGHPSSDATKQTVYDKKPEWRLENNEGKTVTNSGFLFLDPCNPEVKSYLLETYSYILNEYDIDGFQLDYIRFPGSEWGFNKATVDGFREKTGITVTGYDPGASWWKSFCSYRAGFVTDFVASMRTLIDKTAPSVLLSADVMTESTSVTGLLQDSAEWMTRGYLDLVFPMAYGASVPEFQLPSFAERAKQTPIACGLGPFEASVDADEYIEQIRFCREIGCLGQVAFEATAYLNKSIGKYCLSGAYSVPAFCPFLEKSDALAAYKDFIRSRIERCSEALELLTPSQADSLYAAIDSLDAFKSAVSALPDSEAKDSLMADIAYISMIDALPNPLPRGDATLDGKLGAEDAAAVLQYMFGASALSGRAEAVADTDINGVLNITDYISVRVSLLTAE